MLKIFPAVRYRIFALDHMLRPQQSPVHISISVSEHIFFSSNITGKDISMVWHLTWVVALFYWQNTAGNTIMKSFTIPTGGIYSNSFSIPSVSKYVKRHLVQTMSSNITSDTFFFLHEEQEHGRLQHTMIMMWKKLLFESSKSESLVSTNDLSISHFPWKRTDNIVSLKKCAMYSSFTKFWSEDCSGAALRFAEWWAFKLHHLSNVSFGYC